MGVSAKKTYNVVLQTDYAEYVKYVHRGTWKKTHFHEFLCKYVQNFIERPTDKPYEILCIHTPPQHGKSQSITETLPSWYLGRHPDNRVIEISYSESFAIKFGRRNRQKIDEYGGDIFGINLSKLPNTALEFEIEGHQGGMISRGVGTGITGQRCDLLIIDDPIKNNKEAMSTSYREGLYNEWVMSFKTRLWRGAKVVIIMTRWHEDDLVGRLLEEERNIKYLRLPCECEDKNDLLGRQIGETLCPEIGKDREWLIDFKNTMVTKQGSMAWNALYQGRPTAMEGNIINKEWWNYYEGKPPKMVDWVMSVDAAFKDDKQSDFVAIQVWGKNGADMYLIDAIKKHLNFPDTIMEIARLRGMYEDCKITLIEDKANGSAIIQMLHKEVTGIIAVEPYGSKMSRVQAILGAIESGNVYLPKDKKFTHDFVNECASFPNGSHDDQVDAMSQALNRLIYRTSMTRKAAARTNLEKMFPNFFKGDKEKGHGKINVI